MIRSFRHLQSQRIRLDDIDKLDPERLKKENDPHLRHCLEACRIVKEEIGDEVPVGVLITGPYTAATSCYPAEKLFRAMRKSPEKVHRLVQFTKSSFKKGY